MTDPGATMAVVTREALTVAQKASLAMDITAIGYDSLILSVPLGDGENALMATDQFSKCKVTLSPSRPKGVLPPQKPPLQDNATGYIRLPIKDKTEKVIFTLSIGDFIVQKGAGTIEIKLRGNDAKAEPLCIETVVKSLTLPKVQSFTASAYNVTQGNRVTLNWAIDPEGDYELTKAGDAANPLAKGRGGAGTLGRLAAGDYVLSVPSGGEKRRLRIHSYDATGFHSYVLDLAKDGSPTEILGLYAHPERGRLYALLRFGADATRAQLWSTAHGFDDDPATWQPETTKQDTIISVPLEAARRPGVIFQNRLWLLGGDCCHPDRPGSAVGYYDFQETMWHEVGDDDPRRWPGGMAERMGHAVVAVPFENRSRIWVMGGWSQNGGAFGDIWEFDGNSWNQLASTGRACLFGAAATRQAVWRFGGFTSPGGNDCEAKVQRHDKNNKIDIIDVKIADGKQYCASALFAMDEKHDTPSGIGMFYDPDTRGYRRKLFSIDYEREYNVDETDLDESDKNANSQDERTDKLSLIDILPKRDYYHIQSTVFQGAVFFRTLIPNSQYAGTHIRYFVKVGQ